MTPAEELRAAATLLRETASTATPGPWHTVGLPWNHDTPFVVAGHPDPHVGKFVADVEQVFGDDEDDRDHGPDAAWIALASPALAEPLAVLLDTLADVMEWLGPPEVMSGGHLIDGMGVPRIEWDRALTCARAITGRQS